MRRWRAAAEQVRAGARCTSLAVPIAADTPPIAALAVQALVAVLKRTAARLAVESQQSRGAVGR
jgi:hypothetical protein